ncbi:MAG: hypothetical protein JWO31_63 [Phycisphaerales bacterium]|nr:hypothetical protein [Phycisphaerales bacterium]
MRHLILAALMLSACGAVVLAAKDQTSPPTPPTMTEGMKVAADLPADSPAVGTTLPH